MWIRKRVQALSTKGQLRMKEGSFCIYSEQLKTYLWDRELEDEAPVEVHVVQGREAKGDAYTSDYIDGQEGSSDKGLVIVPVYYGSVYM